MFQKVYYSGIVKNRVEGSEVGSREINLEVELIQ